MKIKKLSKKLDFDVEAQERPCNRDCPSSIIYVHNKSQKCIDSLHLS